MKLPLLAHRVRQSLIVLSLLFSSVTGIAQTTENISSGSFIINMGATNPNTIANGLKPYGLIYDLIRNYQVPVKWVISATKLKDGVDFIYNNVQYKGGTFIIPAEYRSASVNARITYWTGLGVVGTTTTSAFSVDVTVTLKAFPKWTLDAQNGAIAEGFLINAGITNTAFPGAYNWKAPGTLDCCDDFFVMPHADPTWATHGNLWTWNKNCLGSIWAGCHAVSVLENMTNPGNPLQKTNFLSTTGLLLFGSHSGGSIPYTHLLPNDPNAQYLGVTDLAQQNGSEQIYMPLPGGAWRPTTQIVAYDPSQANVPANSPGPASVIVYGRGFGDPARGYVMYEASHSINKGSVNDVAAQRAFFNFSFFQLTPKNPQLTITGITEGQQVTNGTILNLTVNATSPLTGISFTYQWTSSCGGTFGSPTAANTTFNPPSTAGGCVVTCKVSDNCGRLSFASFPITVLGPPTPPTVVNDAATIAGSCQPGTSVTIDVLANDVPNTSTISFTSLNQGAASPANAGTWTSTSQGLVTFTPDPNFNGLASITYTVTNTQGISNTATINVTVGTVDGNGCTTNQVYAPAEVNLVTLANFVSQSGTGAALNGTALDDFEDTYITAATDYLNFGTNSNNNLILALGSTFPLRAKDTINIYWSKSSNATGTLSVQIGQSGTGPWTNLQVFSNAIAASGSAGSVVSAYAIPGGVSNITHVRISAGTASPATNSSSNVWVDAVDYNYLSCVSKQPMLSPDADVVLEDAPAIIDLLANDADPQYLPLTLKQITVPPTKGKVSINPDGTVTYISNKDVNGTDVFTYQVCNSQGYCSTAQVNITIATDGCAAGFYRANPPGGAITKIFQSGLSGTNAATANATTSNFFDAFNQQGSTGTNKGAVNKLDVGYLFSSNAARRPVFYFNISEIPTTAIVQSADFSVTRVGGDNTVQNVNVHKLTNSFKETEVTWLTRQTTPSTLTWTTAGGDFNSTPDATTTMGTSNIAYSWSISAAAQNWVTTPANNYGVVMKTGEAVSKRHQIASRENGTISKRPKLIITYVVPDPCTAIPNRAPLANPDYATVMNGQSVVINTLSNDADVDPGNTLSVTGYYGITAGSATNTASTITYTANISATVPRTESLKYIVSDNNGAKDTAIIYITVINAPPSANRDNASTNSGTPVTITVMTNDNDPEGGSLSAPTITVVPKFGTATVSGNNIIYTPGTGYTGKDTLVYQVCEAVAGGCNVTPLCDTALVVITINNQPPVANPDSKTTPPCQTTRMNLVSNDTDPEGGMLTVTNISALSNPAAGTLVNNNDGTVSFTPATGYAGPPVTFTYTVTDNGVAPLTSAPATVTLTITAAVNNKPIAGDDVADPSNMDEVEYYSVRDNDSDPDNDQLTNPVIIVNPLHGTASVLANGLVMYTPNPGFFGRDTLTYRVGDIIFSPAGCVPLPPLYDTALVSYNIIVPNTTNAINDENSTWVNVPVSGGVMGNDYDLEGDGLRFTGFVNSGGVATTSGSITVSGVDAAGSPVANAGTLTINSNGTYTFTPALNFVGLVTVPYTISDNNINPAIDTAYLKITVSPLQAVANSLIANNDENTSYGNPVSGNVVTNDRDPQGNAFTVTGFKYDTNGDGSPDGTGTVGTPVVIGGQTTTGLPTSNAGTLVLNANGSYTFTPAPDFHGSVDVPYTICDNGVPVACATAILHIDVLPDINGPANDPPVAGDDFSYTTVNTPVNGTFINNDSDPNGDPVSLNGVTINTGGPHTPIGAPVATVKGGTVQYYADGTYTYTPPSGYVGPDSVGYTICDVTAVAPQPLCTRALLHLLVGTTNTIMPVNDINNTWANIPVPGNVLTNDQDPEGNALTVTGIRDAAGALQPVGVGGTTVSIPGKDRSGNPVANAGSLLINPDGSYVFTPALNFLGTAITKYTVCDNGAPQACREVNLTIHVDPVAVTNGLNGKPGYNVTIAENDAKATTMNTAVSGNVMANDHDPEGNVQTFQSFQNQNGSGTPISSGATLSGTDAAGSPVANAGTITFVAGGGYTFTPASGFAGVVTVPYNVCDNGNVQACDVAYLTITVVPDVNSDANNRPVGTDDHNVVNNLLFPGSSATGNLLVNDIDPLAGNTVNGTTLTLQAPGTYPTAHGSIVIAANGAYTYTPSDVNYTGPDQFVYTLCDNGIPVLCSQATLYLLDIGQNILPVNLISFTGHRVGKANMLYWSTAQESNSHHIDVESKTDNSVFAAIGTLAAKGYSSITTNYRFVHPDPPAGVNYYRLKLVDRDGRFNYSNTIAIRDDGTGVPLFAVYPNPFRDQVEMAITFDRAAKIRLQLYDVSGKLVRTSTVIATSGFRSIRLSGLENLASGTYFLEMRSEEQTIRTKLFKTY